MQPATSAHAPPSPIDCETAVRRLWDYLDGRLPAMTHDDVEAHLSSCERCLPHFAFAGEMKKALAASPVPLSSDDESRLRLRVRSALERVIATDAKEAEVYEITTAQPTDLPLLPSIELAGARLLADYLGESDLLETTSPEALAAALRRGHLWVARVGGVPVGFAHVVVLDPNTAHLEEIDVRPEYGRRGLGRRLVMAVCEWAARQGYRSVTLTTFRDVPWNMPFYGRLGFEEIPSEQLEAALLSIFQNEARRGLDPARRVVMRRACTV